ncbi:MULTISPECIES: putative bifunctional diguanylate cyclase/phosphodiesterase [Agrobacterium]|uniref:Bifunctional diguanylate cyclase/phosphodiesterase n=1 Tax=Agrobacterium tumefaciens TaxID=358 RepID=A0A4D7YMI5_AGRTU|nr:bifunctional diguanylate cyclase/phosphodiesterase [Agrobacterium tumefaciens]QCL96957.1 bifunctional diguanylate cyclase/phosphodiesterase [Agrobacterium tumefaciens]
MKILTATQKLQDFMSVRSDNPDLLKAQYRAFTRQMPMMYFILLSSTWALAVTHMRLAPPWLTVGVPALFTLGCTLRVTFWWRTRGMDPEPRVAHAALRRTNRLAAGIAMAFTLWSFLLVPYGDAYTQSHVAFYMAITVISCIFCLMYVRSAAFTVTLIVNGAFIAFFLASRQPTFVAIAINVLLVCIGMMSILLTNYRNFERMVISQQRTEALSNENLLLANIDSLTELPNRRAFFAHLEAELEKARANGTRLALGVIDLDGFKPVNDLYGHSVGDRLLVNVSKRLTANLKASRAFRLGGDEFAIVAPIIPDDAQLVTNANAISEQLRAPYHMPEGTVHVSASMGIAVFPNLASTLEQLFDRADYALYHAKKTRRGDAVLFDAEHEKQINIEARVEHLLKQRDMENELSVVFQPIVDIRDGRTAGFEALARWHSPVLGHVPPCQFFPIAERAGIVGSLTRPLLKMALASAAKWEPSLRLSFNLSAQDLNSHEGVLSLLGIIENSSFDARRLDLEITETAFAHDFEQVRQSVEMLRRLGCGISLDDFGTGYSSLTRLHALPLTKIKVDRSFVTDLHEKPASYKIVKSLLTLSRDMELECVVEGVETPAELTALQGLGATLVQGYIYAPPLREEDVGAFLSGQASPKHRTKSTALKNPNKAWW